MIISGPVRTWPSLKGEKGREYIVVSLEYGQAKDLFRSDLYSAKSGKGEQRTNVESHKKAIARDTENDNYTPATFSAGTRTSHRNNIKREIINGVEFASIDVSPSDPLPLTDGDHRSEVFGSLLEKHPTLAGAPVEFLVFLNGDTQKDFLNLQKGRPVDSAHLLSMTVQRGLVPRKNERSYKLGLETAKVLHSDPRSPFYMQIKFDSQGMYLLPITTLMAKGPSDLGSSLLGLARIGLDGGDPSESVDTSKWLADRVIDIVRGIDKTKPELLTEGMLLAKPPDSTKGSCTMLLGMGILLAFRVRLKENESPEEIDISRLIDAASNNLSQKADGTFSAQTKRVLLGAVARDYFRDMDIPKHEGIPIGLLKTFVTSSYGCSPLPKNKKPKKTEEVKPTVDEVADNIIREIHGIKPDENMATKLCETLSKEGDLVWGPATAENLSDPDHDLKIKSAKVRKLKSEGKTDEAYAESEKIYDDVMQESAAVTSAPWEN